MFNVACISAAIFAIASEIDARALCELSNDIVPVHAPSTQLEQLTGAVTLGAEPLQKYSLIRQLLPEQEETFDKRTLEIVIQVS